MALDPSIILGIKPLEQQDPYRQAAVVSGLKDQAQLRDERALQLMGMKRQQETASALDQALSKATILDPATGQVHTDRAAALQNLKQGGFGSAALGLQEGWQKADQAQVKANLDNQQTMLKNQQMHVEAIGQISNAVLTAPVDQQPQLYAQVRQHMIQQGIVTPDELPEQYNPQVVQAAQAQSMKASEVIAAQAKKVDQDQRSLELAQTASNNAANQLLSKQRNQLEARGQDLTHADRRAQLSIEAGRLHLEQSKQAIDSGGAVEAQAKQIAQYELPMPSMSRNNAYNKAVMARALEINPALSSEGYATKQDFLSSKGKANAQVQSLNKLSSHLNELQSASENAGFSPTGMTSAGKDLRLAEQLFSKEDVKFLSGSGVGTEGELNGLISKIHSPIQAVRDSAIQTLSKFTADAARQLGDQYERGTKLKFDPNQHFTPDTVKLLATHGGTSARSNGMVTMRAPNGQTKSVPSDQLEHYKSLGATEVK